MPDELILFEKMQRGDTSALEYFFREYTDVLYYRALGFVKDNLAAEDIVQEVFIRFWQLRKNLKITDSVPGYLCKAVDHRCHNYLEHLKVKHRYEESQKWEEVMEEVSEDEEELNIMRERLKMFVDSLPEKCREIFILACIEGLKYKQVAEKLDVSVNTVKTQLKSAYSKLRAEFNENDLEEIRNKNEQYLMDDVSIIVARNKKNNSGIFVCDMLEWTDHNILNVLGRFPKELLTFLDPSIEYLECSLNDKKVDIRLKFYGKEEIIINNTRILENYLSSGTIKGLGVFMSAAFSFSEGGYMIIDEIENHFNREIVATLIRFFMDEKVNKKGATILFSTHYSELLDEFERNDSIYIVRNKGGIGVENLSSILKRNDIKKSEVYDSGYLGGTVPEYEAYMALKKVFEKRI